MPYIETPGELAAWLYDQMGVYEKPACVCASGQRCSRSEFESCLVERILNAAETETLNIGRPPRGFTPAKRGR